LAVTAPRALERGRLTGIAFMVVSSAALATLVYLVQWHVAPALLEYWFGDSTGVARSGFSSQPSC
jgi:hypothetical protein